MFVSKKKYLAALAERDEARQFAELYLRKSDHFKAALQDVVASTNIKSPNGTTVKIRKFVEAVLNNKNF